MYEKENTDATMSDSVDDLEKAVIGRKIVSVEERGHKTVVTLDDGSEVEIEGEGDCCAYTEVESFWVDPSMIDHVILGVSTTDYYSTWHIYATMGSVMGMDVAWSEGTGYYAYGFDVNVKKAS